MHVLVARLAPALVIGVLAGGVAAGRVSPAVAGAAREAAEARSCLRDSEQRGGTSAKHEISSGGIERTFILRLPRGYEKRTDWPLIVAFHGRGSTGTEVEGYSGLSDLPAVVAYPNGVVGTGDGYRQAWQGAPYSAPGVDDVGFTEVLLDHLQATLCVDTDRTYATGKSNGAGLVAALACQLPGRLAAIAPVAGAFYPATRVGCGEANPTPVINLHGDGDATIPYGGDPDRGLPPIRGWVEEWAARNGCEPPRGSRTVGADVTIYAWRDCIDGADVEHVVVAGGGHVWPGADVYSGGGYVTHTIDAHNVVWRFLKRHSLTAKDQA